MKRLIKKSSDNTIQYNWDVLKRYFNCYEISNIEVYLRGGRLIRGTAINPNGVIPGYRDSHTWVERDGQIIDRMNWVDHKMETEVGPMTERNLEEVIEQAEEFEI